MESRSCDGLFRLYTTGVPHVLQICALPRVESFLIASEIMIIWHLTILISAEIIPYAESSIQPHISLREPYTELDTIHNL